MLVAPVSAAGLIAAALMPATLARARPAPAAGVRRPTRRPCSTAPRSPSIPFIAVGRVGILGVGLVNDDMANHLLIADWLNARVGEMPALIHQGYPLGPHALVAGLARPAAPARSRPSPG